MVEVYRLELSHYMVDEETQERIRLEQPIYVEQVFGRRYDGSQIILNRMLDEMKRYILEKMEEASE